MYLHTVDLGLDSLIQLQTELVELGVVTSTERVGPEWPASPVAVGDVATHSSVLAWRIPGTEEPGGLPSVGSHRVGHD